MEGEVMADASAALGIIARRGVGKVRHLDTSHLWIQEAAAKKALKFGKVLGTENCADMFTKALDANSMSKHLETLNMKIGENLRSVEVCAIVKRKPVMSVSRKMG